MNEIEKSRVAEIVKLHAEIGGYLKMTLDKAIRIGGLLTEQKAECGHGAWLPWLEANLPFSERLARDYMRFWERRDELKSANLADLTDARKYLAPPPESPAEGNTNKELMQETRRYINSLPSNPIERLRILHSETKASLIETNQAFLVRATKQIEMGRIWLALELRKDLEKDLSKVMAEIDALQESAPSPDGINKVKSAHLVQQWQTECERTFREMDRIAFLLGQIAHLKCFPELEKCRVLADPPQKLSVEEVRQFAKLLCVSTKDLSTESLERAIDEVYEEKLKQYHEYEKATPNWLMEDSRA